MAHTLSIFERLDFSPEGVVDVVSGTGNSAIKNHFVRQALSLDLGIEKIYFSGDFPTIYFKSVIDFDSSTIDDILRVQRKIWNQGKVVFLYIESPTEIRVYNCYEKPINSKQEDRDIEEILLYTASKQVKKDLDTLAEVFGKVAIETGNFWSKHEFSKKVKHQRRVEQALIDNLRQTRKRLGNAGLEGNKGKAIIHDLLLRSLFVLYLEDRKATDADFYGKYKKGAASFFDLLDNLEATYLLFAQLEDSFNGNLSPVTEIEKQQVTSEHLQLIKECFWSRLKIDGQQKLFDWRVYDFGAIPIELISAIYEEFLTEKEGEENQAKTGAYYTPRPLAEFILNKMLPYPSQEDCRHNVRVLDPTCGSGIFLVETLNRLLDRWELSHGRPPDFETTKCIALDNIFGIDIQQEAIKVAAFSLYLAMLNRLDPKTLWLKKKFPYLIHDPENLAADKQGSNLFVQSSLGPGNFEQIEFDLVVGNPPFGRGSLDQDVSAYLTERYFPQEAVIAFLSRAVDLCPKGKIALVFAAKILFNKDRTYENFRRFLFKETYVEEVYNFAALRRLPKDEGGNFFATASSPVGALFYSKTEPPKPSNRVLYCSPKSAAKYRLIDGLAIDPTDVRYLPRTECSKPDTIIWKAAMWGTERDFRFIQRQLDKVSSLGEILEKNGWMKNAGVGFETSSPKKHKDCDIKKLPFLHADNVERYFSLPENTKTIYDEEFYRLGKKGAFKQPHLLIKEGQTAKRFCASFLDYDCSFRKTVYGIHTSDSVGLKLLTAFLNSSLATYLLFLSPSSWGVERERVKPNEVLDLPDLCFSLPQNAQGLIVGLVDQIIELKKTQLVQPHEIEAIEYKIDEEFYEALGYSENERILIEDLIANNLDVFQEGQKSKAYNPSIPDEDQKYAALLCKTLNEFLKLGSQNTCWATTYETSPRLPLKVISVHINTENTAGAVENGKTTGLHEILKVIEASTYQ
ncbi:MAG: N-6 DNA methylase [Saprospiraceae bacterium]|nr:N-6 DNA methylase [Saprospiraceae bacterium]